MNKMNRILMAGLCQKADAWASEFRREGFNEKARRRKGRTEFL
jgi:hypothetical protein